MHAVAEASFLDSTTQGIKYLQLANPYARHCGEYKNV